MTGWLFFASSAAVTIAGEGARSGALDGSHSETAATWAVSLKPRAVVGLQMQLCDGAVVEAAEARAARNAALVPGPGSSVPDSSVPDEAAHSVV